MNYSLISEAPGDAADIETLMDAAFGPDRHKRSVARLRDGVAPLPELGFVARIDGTLVASIRFWPVLLPDDSVIPLLGPLAVNPDIRGMGLGRALVRKGLDTVRASNAKAVLIIGDPGYYAPFEFGVEAVRGLDIGGPVVPLTLMGIEYSPGSLSGQTGTIRRYTQR